MLNVTFTNRIKRDRKLARKRGKDLNKLDFVLKLLANEEPLPEKYKDHQLKGNYKGCRECHIEPDWLLIYKVDNDELILIAIATGTHADLFDL